MCLPCICSELKSTVANAMKKGSSDGAHPLLTDLPNQVSRSVAMQCPADTLPRCNSGRAVLPCDRQQHRVLHRNALPYLHVKCRCIMKSTTPTLGAAFRFHK
jgi:hypothetical protein